MLEELQTALRRFFRYVARPVRQDRGAEGLVVEPYRGYGTRREIFFMGRVYRQPGGRVPGEVGDLYASLRRLLRRGAAKQTVSVRLAGREERVVTDARGYFRVHMRVDGALPSGRVWHEVPLWLELPSGDETQTSVEVFVPPEEARYVVISDIDDTVMLTGVAQKAKMFWRLFAQGARSRVAFPGVGALYRALHGTSANPILYVSRGPWSIYSMLEAFFVMHRIPVGPILFLRDWGMSLKRPVPKRATEHKLALIRQMLALYEDLPFVLIGDSGQHDPETYTRVVHENPERVLSVLIRNVTRDRQRTAAIEALAQEVLEAGSSLLLAADSTAMAKHAVERGLVASSTVAEVAGERFAESGESSSAETHEVCRSTRRETESAVANGDLSRELDTNPAEPPPSTVVESESDRR